MPASPSALPAPLVARAGAALAAAGAPPPAHPGTDALLDALDAAVAALEPGPDEPGGDRWRTLLELHDLRSAIAQERLSRRLLTFGRIHEALVRLRGLESTDAMIRAAPREVARAGDFDRVALYRVDGPNLLAEAFFVDGDPEAGRRMLEFSRRNPAPLQDQILETEMIRRRRPMVVHDALNHPLTYKPLVTFYNTHAYVAAPIMPEGRVIGFIHAEKGLRRPEDPEGVDDLDRDILWAFAEGFGFAVERMQLLERLRAQGRELRRLIAETDSVVAEHLAAQVELVSGPLEGATARTAAALFAAPQSSVEAVLTRREREVLALVAHGATNAQIAEQLVITEGTAKSHVKRILRKLGATNRVEAASMFLRARAEE